MGSDSRRAPEAWILEGDTTGTTCRALVFPKGGIADPTAQRGTNRLAPSVRNSFLGAVRAALHEFPPASAEDPRRETAGAHSNHAPEAWCSGKEGDTSGPKIGGLVFSEGDIADPNVERGYQRVAAVGF